MSVWVYICSYDVINFISCSLLELVHLWHPNNLNWDGGLSNTINQSLVPLQLNLRKLIQWEHLISYHFRFLSWDVMSFLICPCSNLHIYWTLHFALPCPRFVRNIHYKPCDWSAVRDPVSKLAETKSTLTSYRVPD